MAGILSKYDVRELAARADRLKQGSSDTRGNFTRGLAAGTQQVHAMGYGAMAAAGDVLGSDAMANRGIEGYEDNMYEASKHAGDVMDVTQIQSLDDAGSWAAYTLGSQLPTLLTIIGTGGVAAGAGTVAAKTLGKKVLKSRIERVGAQIMARGVPQQQAMQQAARTVVDAAAKTVAKKAGTKGVQAASIGASTGEIAGAQYDATGELHGVSAMVSGTVAGMIDTIPLMRIFNRAGMDSATVKDGINRTVAKRLGQASGSVLKQMALEGGTEGVQTLIEQAAVDYAEENFDMFTAADLKELVNAIAAGALLGGTMGIPRAVAEQSSRFAGVEDADQALNDMDAVIDSLTNPQQSPQTSTTSTEPNKFNVPDMASVNASLQDAGAQMVDQVDVGAAPQNVGETYTPEPQVSQIEVGEPTKQVNGAEQPPLPDISEVQSRVERAKDKIRQQVAYAIERGDPSAFLEGREEIRRLDERFEDMVTRVNAIEGEQADATQNKDSAPALPKPEKSTKQGSATKPESAAKESTKPESKAKNATKPESAGVDYESMVRGLESQANATGWTNELSTQRKKLREAWVEQDKQDDDVLHPDGMPFKTQKRATTVSNRPANKDKYDVVPLAHGYTLRPKLDIEDSLANIDALGGDRAAVQKTVADMRAAGDGDQTILDDLAAIAESLENKQSKPLAKDTAKASAKALSKPSKAKNQFSMPDQATVERQLAAKAAGPESEPTVVKPVDKAETSQAPADNTTPDGLIQTAIDRGQNTPAKVRAYIDAWNRTGEKLNKSVIEVTDEQINSKLGISADIAVSAAGQGKDESEHEIGSVGGQYATGQVIQTKTGRLTSPFPKVDVGSDRKAGNTIRRVDKWLMEEALKEAESIGDNFNAPVFRQSLENIKNLSPSDKDGAEEYLFGDSAPVAPPKSILKPLNGKPKQTKGKAPAFDPSNELNLSDRRDAADRPETKKITFQELQASGTSILPGDRQKTFDTLDYTDAKNTPFTESQKVAAIQALRRHIRKVAIVDLFTNVRGAHDGGTIAVNAALFRDADQSDLVYTITHEIGHAIHSLRAKTINDNPAIAAELPAIESYLYPGLREKVSAAKNLSKEQIDYFNYVLSANELLAEFHVATFQDAAGAEDVAPALYGELLSAIDDSNLLKKRKTFPVFGSVVERVRGTLSVSGTPSLIGRGNDFDLSIKAQFTPVDEKQYPLAGIAKRLKSNNFMGFMAAIHEVTKRAEATGQNPRALLDRIADKITGIDREALNAEADRYLGDAPQDTPDNTQAMDEAAAESTNLTQFGKALAERIGADTVKALRRSGTLREEWSARRADGKTKQPGRRDGAGAGAKDTGDSGVRSGSRGSVSTESGSDQRADSEVGGSDSRDGQDVPEGGDARGAGPIPADKDVPRAAGETGAGVADRSGSKTPADVVADTRPPDFFMADPEAIVGGTQGQRFKKNKAALELHSELQASARAPTPEEMNVLASYTGWGSFGQELFNGSWDAPRFKPKWEERGQWLQEQLGKEAWLSAQRSITNAHYTDPPTVKTMWDMVKRAGFNGGRWLEPAMGTGNFPALMPRNLYNKSQFTGIELDEMTGSIAQMLFQRANINIKSYQDSQTPDGFYDLVIGNWPFENVTVADRRYLKEKPKLHDYFFLKALDQVRAGGLVVGITSRFTMDKVDPLIRRRMAEKAELVAAFRLPTGAFDKYAGTSVITDIIILKKRETPEVLVSADTSPWINVAEYKTPSGEMVRLNQYYHDNPDNVLGTVDFGTGTTTGRPDMIVKRPKDLEQRLTQAVERVPADVMTTASERLSYIANHTDERVGALGIQDGELIVSYGEQALAAEDVKKFSIKSEKKTAEREDALRQIIEIRKAYGQVIQADTTGSNDAKAHRKTLKSLYDAYVADHGTINDSWALKYLASIHDPNLPILQALEVQKNDAWVPSGILSQPTIRTLASIDNPSIEDAYVLERQADANPSMEDVAKRAGKPVEEVERSLIDAGAVYRTPYGDTEASDIFLAGNVRRKYADVQRAIEAGEQGLEGSLEALKNVIPKDVPYHEIEAQLGAPWVPIDVYQQYIAHMLNDNDPSKFDVSYRAGKWKAKLPRGTNSLPAANSNFGSPAGAINFTSLLSAAFTNRNLTIQTRDADGNKVFDPELTKEANTLVEKIREEFNTWLWSDPERTTDLEKAYNESKNAVASPAYDGSFLKMPGMALQVGTQDFNLRKHQLDAIWRGLVNRRGMYAHEVGTGKSFVIAGLAVESRRYGFARKPLIIAHNANSRALARDVNMMYPGARVKYIPKMGKDTIERDLLSIANDDWDAVVIPHSAVGAFKFKVETLMAMAQEEIDALEAEIAAEIKEGENIDDFTLKDIDDDEKIAKLRNPTAKELAKQRKAIIERIKKQAMQASNERAIAFEDLGIDMVLVDEVHEFKKPPIATRMSVKGLNTTSNDKSTSLFFMSNYVLGQNQGRNVHTFTGTLITNTLTELYAQMRYTMPQEMKDQGIEHWDGFFNTFMATVQDIELSAAGEYEMQTRLSAFVNLPELRLMIGQYMDTVFANDMPSMQPRKTDSGKTLDDPTLNDAERDVLENGRTENASNRPYKKVVSITSEMSDAQMGEFSRLQALAKSFRNASRRERKRRMLEGHESSPILVETKAAAASFDMRLVDGEKNAGREGQLPDDPKSKSSQVVSNVFSIYNSHPEANQVIFMGRGVDTTAERSVGPPGEKTKQRYKTFSTMLDIIERLVDQGIPRHEIAVINGNTSPNKRAAIADAMNNSEIRVVLGTIRAMGVGVNMQKNLRAMHHMDAPWMPGELEQGNGRGHRQGNQWNTVLELRYLTDRIDGRRWQVLSIKDRFINRFMTFKGNERSLEADSDFMNEEGGEGTLLETFSKAAGDARILQKAKYTMKQKKLEGKERLHVQAQADAKRMLRNLKDRTSFSRSRIAELKTQQPVVQEFLDAPFTVEVDGKTYTKTKDANQAVAASVGKLITGRIDEVITVGTFKNIAVRARMNFARQVVFSMDIGGYEVETEAGTNIYQALSTKARQIYKRIAALETDTAKDRSDIDRLAGLQGQPFKLAGELDAVRAQIARLDTDLAFNPVPAPFWLRDATPVGTDVMYQGQPYEVTGHRWSADGYFVLSDTGDHIVQIPYDEAKDQQGIRVYEDHEFVAPEIIGGEDTAQANAAEKTDNNQASPGSPASYEPRWSVLSDIPEMSIPGFRQWVLSKSDNPQTDQDAAFSRRTDARGGMPIDKVRSIVKRVAKRQKNVRAIEVVERLSDVPGFKSYAHDPSIGGVYDNDTVYVIAAGNHTDLQVEESILHEVQHQATRARYGKDANRKLSRIAELINKHHGSVKQYIDDRGIDYDFAWYDAEFKRRGLSQSQVNARHIDELLAIMASQKAGKDRIVNRLASLARAVIAEIRRWLRSQGFKLSASLPDDELIHTLSQTAKALHITDTPRTIRNTVAFHKAFHGSPHKFETFSTDAIGTGEGQNAQGWGLYFSSTKEVAQYYKDLPVYDDALGKPAPGSISEVTLAPKPDEYLDWDKQPGEQSALVKKALADMGYPVDYRIQQGADGDWELIDPTGEVEDVYSSKDEAQESLDNINAGAVAGGPTGKDIYESIEIDKRSPKAASLALLDAGIRGVVYTNGLQPGDPGGFDKNYVIFDANDITVDAMYNRRRDADGNDQASDPDLDLKLNPAKTPLRGKAKREAMKKARERRAQLSTAVDKTLDPDAAMRDKTIYENLITKVRRAFDTGNKGMLGVLTRRQLIEVMEPLLPQAMRYQRQAEMFDADRRTLQSQASDIAEAWGKLPEKTRELLAKVMQAATLAGVDPAETYTPLITKKQYSDELKKLSSAHYYRQARKKGGTQIIEAKKQALQRLVAQEEARAEKRNAIEKAWEKLPADAQSIYRRARNYHEKMHNETLAAIEDRIMRATVNSNKKRELWESIKQEFETQKVQAPYFPLARFGEYWVVSYDPDGTRLVDTFETKAEWEAFIKETKEESSNVSYGKNIPDMLEAMSIPVDFVAKIHDLMDNGMTREQDPTSWEMRDELQQLYLQSLPELSARHARQHRKKVLGFSRDALRAFSDSAFHTSHMVARLRHQHILTDQLEQLKKDVKESHKTKALEQERENLIDFKDNFLAESVKDIQAMVHMDVDDTEKKRFQAMVKLRERYGDEKEVNARIQTIGESLATADLIADPAKKARAADYVSELGQTHRDMMNPQVHSLANNLNALGFMWYLGVTPAAAMVNLLQTPMMALPHIGSEYGMSATMKMMQKTTADFMKKGRADNSRFSLRTSMTTEESAAFRQLVLSGVLDITQSMDLAGLAEDGMPTGSLAYKTMKMISFSFHHAERMNREVTAMTTYRLARKAGKSVDQATQAAADMTWKTHYDYGSTNRARFFRGNWQRVFLQFKQFSAATTYLYIDTFRRAYREHARTPEEKAHAKQAFKYMLGMQFAVAGALGMPGLRLAGVLLENAMHLFDEEDEFAYETAMRQWSVDFLDMFLPENAAKNVGQAFNKGLFDAFTPVSLHGRTSISELWWRSPNRELEARDAFADALKQMVGPIGSIVENTGFVGPELISQGHVYRGVEAMVPKFIKDAMQGMRFASEDALTLKGNLVTDIRGHEAIIKMLGFTPSRLSDQYDQNSARYKLQNAKQAQRSRVLRASVDAKQTPARTDDRDAKRAVREWNKQNPTYKIQPEHIRLSEAARERNNAQTESGFKANRRLLDAVERLDFAS